MRPLNEREEKTGGGCVQIVSHRSILVRDAGLGASIESKPAMEFTFDSVFSERTDQSSIFTTTCRELVGSVMEGYNATLFVYGQTSSGKTYTMEGDEEEGMGIVYRSMMCICEEKRGWRVDRGE